MSNDSENKNTAQEPGVSIEVSQDNAKAQKRPAKGKQAEHGKNPSKIGVWFKEIRAEAGKIIWPNRKELAKMTFTVIVTSLLFGALIAGMDTAFRFITGILVSLNF